MGSRGAFEKSGMTGIAPSQREYSVIDHIEGIKVVTWDGGKNNRTPVYSNTPNAIYFSCSAQDTRIEKIYFYKNHRLVRSVDMKEGEEPVHAHDWSHAGAQVGRIAHDKKNIHSLTPRERDLYEAASRWNAER